MSPTTTFPPPALWKVSEGRVPLAGTVSGPDSGMAVLGTSSVTVVEMSPSGVCTTACTSAVPSTVLAPTSRSERVTFSLTFDVVSMGDLGVAWPTTCVCGAVHTTDAVIGSSRMTGNVQV